jgi:chromosomal replication initiator protein
MWRDVLDKALPSLPEGSEEMWLSSCVPTAVDEGELVVDVANVFVKEQIVSRFLGELNKAAKEIGDVSIIRLSVSEEPTGGSREEWENRAKGAVGSKFKSGLNLNAGYTFKSFVVGKSNRLAHAASAAVAETPGDAFNPLFIWGGVGLGKTHLMHAICHYALEKKNNLNVVYVSSEKFVSEFIQSIQTKQGQEFKNKYRTVDILLIDDIQFMGDKHSSQEEFFYTFDSLREVNKQIVICSDRAPTELKNIEDRLKSRFTWGLVTDIQPPDLETRIAILQKKAQLRGCDIPRNVIDFLAQRIPSNIRELEGALNRVIADSKISKEPISVGNASVWLKDMLRPDVRGPSTINAIQSVVAENLNITVEELLSPKRTAEIAKARQIAMYLCGELTEQSQQAIARAFNKKDHTTFIHAQRKISQLIKDDPNICQIVENIRSKL